MRGNGKTNEFGMQVLMDYGSDDLNKYRDDAPEERLTVHGVLAVLDAHEPARKGRKVKALMVALDPNMPANLRPAINTMEGWAPIRQPDFFDDGMAVWMHEAAAVMCPLEMVGRNANGQITGNCDAARELVNGGWRGRVGQFPSEWGYIVEPYGPLAKHPAAFGRTAAAQTEWRIVQEALVPEGCL